MAHQRNGGGFNGHVAPTPHGNPHVRLGQRRGIVDAVADHRHLTALTLQVFNGVRFAIRQYARNHLVNTGLPGDGVCRCWVISGQHHQTVARAVQALQGVHAILTKRIAHGQQRGGLAIDRKQNWRGALRRLRFQLAFQRGGINTVVIKQCLVAQQQRVAFGFTADAEPAQGTVVADLWQGRCIRFIKDGARQRMAGALLQRRGKPQRVRFGNACGRDGYYLRFAFGQRAGFIKHQRVQGAGPLQRVCIPHQHAKLSGAAYAGDNRHRRRQAKGARTGDDQHRGGNHQGINNLRRWAEEIPDRRAQQGNTDHHRHKNGGNFVSELANLRLTALRLAHHANNARQRGVAADGAGGEQHAAVLYHRTGMNGVTV